MSYPMPSSGPLPTESASVPRNFEVWRAQFQAELFPPPQSPANASLSAEGETSREFRPIAAETFALSPALSGALRQASAAAECSPQVTLLAALAALLRRYSGEDGDTIALGVSREAETQVTLERAEDGGQSRLRLPMEFPGAVSFRELQVRVQTSFEVAKASAAMPFSEPPVSPADITDALQPAYSSLNAPPSAPAETSPALELSFAWDALADEIRVTIHYAPARYDSGSIHRLCGHYLNLLEGAVRDPDAEVSRLPLLTPAESQHLLEDWNATSVDYPAAGRGLHELIEDQTRLTPDRTALVFENESLTYAQMDRRANQIAHHLRALGAAPES